MSVTETLEGLAVAYGLEAPCTRCGEMRPVANLTRVGAERVCPEDLAAQHEREMATKRFLTGK